MSARVEVTVRYEGGTIASRENMPVRKRSDGTAGVVWARQVYPLRPDHTIDLGDEPMSKAECPAHFDRSEPLRYAGADPVGKYFLERTRSKAYLVFDGEEDQAERIHQAFEEKGLSGGYGESFRPAKDGNFYDWFVRLPSWIDDEVVAEVMARSEPAETDQKDKHEDLLRLLLGQLDLDIFGLVKLLNTITSERDEAVAELDALREDMEALQIRTGKSEARSRKAMAARETHVAALLAENRALRDDQARTGTGAGKANRTLEEAEARIRKHEREKEQMAKELAEKADIIGMFEDDNEALNMELARVRERNRELEREMTIPAITPAPRTTTRTKEAKRLLDAVCKVLLPHIELTGGDRKNLLEGFPDPTDCLSHLRRLNEGERPSGAKGYKGVEGLWEIGRVRTGRPECASNGRIYFRKRDEGLDVGLHVKVDDLDQKRFVSTRFKF